MATFKGFNTINQVKKFTLTDFDLIKRDILNAFLIREGEVPGRPDLGSNIWSYIFEPMVEEVRDGIDTEVRRIINEDSRLRINDLKIFSGNNTIQIDVKVEVLPNVDAKSLSISFDKQTNTASIN